jgi:hypothetical protein
MSDFITVVLQVLAIHSSLYQRDLVGHYEDLPLFSANQLYSELAIKEVRLVCYCIVRWSIAFLWDEKDTL